LVTKPDDRDARRGTLESCRFDRAARAGETLRKPPWSPPLPNTDDTPAPRSTPRPRFQPSLLGEADAPGRSGPNSDLGQMRMLDELEAVVRPRAAAQASPVKGWLLGLLGTGVVLAAAAWWWNQQGGAARTPQVKALAVKPVPAAPLAAPVLAVQSPPTDAASAPARIETVAAALAATSPAPQPAPVPEPIEAAVRPAPVAAPATRPAAARVPSAAVAKAEPKAAAEKVTTVITPSGKWTVTVADVAPAPNARAAAPVPAPKDKMLASPAAAVARTSATNAANATTGEKADDADVLLLSALLAHVSRADTNGALPEQDRLTIAQLVKRCDARATEEARECRRRICEGYWGKAEACPAPATPKKG
jgi:outer membrane biosynthesis protein TonB